MAEAHHVQVVPHNPCRSSARRHRLQLAADPELRHLRSTLADFEAGIFEEPDRNAPGQQCSGRSAAASDNGLA